MMFKSWIERIVNSKKIQESCHMFPKKDSIFLMFQFHNLNRMKILMEILVNKKAKQNNNMSIRKKTVKIEVEIKNKKLMKVGHQRQKMI